MLKKLVGTPAFYKRVLALAVPIMLQNGITNFVNMLDNIMVGRVGTLEMTGVAVANQLLFVFNLLIFGAVSGVGIFGAQYFGKGDHKGVRQSFRLKILTCLLFSAIGIIILYLFCEPLVSMYLKGKGNSYEIAGTMGFAKEYIFIMFIGLAPYALSQCYSSTLRECDQSILPMVASIIAVVVNLVLNYTLIFGKFGCPALGVRGAAVATVVSRFAEIAVLAVWTRLKSKKNIFIVGAYRRLFKIPATLIKQFIIKGTPLMLNEVLWAMGLAFVNKLYSELGFEVVAATNIMQTFFNVFSVTFMSVGGANGIIIGQLLGANKKAEAKSSCVKLIAFSVSLSIIIGGIFIGCAQFIPLMYNTTENVRYLSKMLMVICAVFMPLDAFVHASYFTLRSGGKTLITFAFDSCFMWIVNVPVALVLVRFTNLDILQVYALCQSVNIIKCIIGFCLIKKGVWLKSLVSQET